MKAPEPPKLVAKSNITLSIIVHSLVIVGLTFLAAREGILGEQFKEIAVVIVPKDKPKEEPEPEPEKPVEEPLVESLKPEEPILAAEAPVVAAPEPAKSLPDPAAPSRTVVSSAPPPTTIAPDFFIPGGRRAVEASSDPTEVYRSLIEYTFHSAWNYPRDIGSADLLTEVEVSVDAAGNVTVKEWRLSGNQAWDDSVRSVFRKGLVVRRPPPKGFPGTVIIRFDVITYEVADLQ